jgi:hypothetical protein
MDLPVNIGNDLNPVGFYLKSGCQPRETADVMYIESWARLMPTGGWDLEPDL